MSSGPPDWSRLRPADDAYPILLREAPLAPELQIRGSIDPAAEMIAIVGSRRCTPYGEELAFEIASDLAGLGLVIVSGLARGIDAAAHRGALAAGGRTVAVMGTGPDRVYPPEHRALAQEVAASGALLTQFPVGIMALPHHFPVRNATISGLCLGVVVVEAKRRSGAMLTAASAGEQGRVVMAIPGSVRNPNSVGCHDLIRDGARLVTGAGDVVREVRADPLLRLLSPDAKATDERPRHGDLRDAVLDLLAGAPFTLGEIASRLDRPGREVALAAGQLRLDGEIALRDGVYTGLGNRSQGRGG